MNKPTIELIPERPAVRADGPTEINVLIRVIPPVVETVAKRPPLNLGLVIDRSGSMHGDKLKAAKQAAIFAVQQLTATDRVSVTIFDDEVQTIVPTTLATDKTAIVRAIERVVCDGSTALHAAWVEGGIQVSSNMSAERLNRVLLLTDGLANVGETNHDRICSDVNGLSRRSVTTTTMGVGADFNEDLLLAMAKSGDGNYYFIESAKQLPDIFASELQGLMATTGQKVSLGIEPQGGAEVTSILNDLERNPLGRLMLSNLIAGSPIQVVVRLLVPARKAESDICFARLAWDDPRSGERHVLRESLSLAVVAAHEFDALPQNAQVAEEVNILELARIRQQAIAEMERGDVVAARTTVQQGRDFIIRGMAASPAAAGESAELDEIDQKLIENDVSSAGKHAKYQYYRKHHSR